MAARHFQALVFDLGGVIASHDNERLYRAIAARCSASNALDRVRGSTRNRDLGTGRLTVRALHDHLQATLGLLADWQEFVPLWSSHLGLDVAMLDYVEALTRDRRVMIFSNTNAEHWAFAVALSNGRLAAIEAYLSHEIGQVKPDAEAFLDVARRARIEPRDCLFIDDLQENVDGARVVGFEAWRFTGQADLAAYLG